jgi:hypothetical protein
MQKSCLFLRAVVTSVTKEWELTHRSKKFVILHMSPIEKMRRWSKDQYRQFSEILIISENWQVDGGRD